MSEGSPRPALSWAAEQQLLGVGVRVQRRTGAQRRHAAAVDATIAELHLGRRDPVPQLVDARLAALRARLWRAPSWIAHLRRAGMSPDDLRSTDDLAHVPPLDRDGYAHAWREAFDADGDPELHLATSSGSTGQALLVPRSGYDGVHMWAAIRFWVATLGIALPARPRLALLCTLPGGLEYSVRAPLFHDGALHRISTVRPDAARRLQRVQPAILSTDPAGLAWASTHADLPPPRLILSSAVHLAPSLRARFPAPIINYFATTETGPIAWECLIEGGRFHVMHPDVWVDTHHDQLAITRLRDSPLPLLRYLTGDRGRVVDGECACGARGRSIVGFTGREPAAFRTPDGRDVDGWALSWLFKDLPLVPFELAQVGVESFRLTLAETGAVPPALLVERLERALARLGFARARVELVSGLPPRTAKSVPFVRR